MITYGVSSDFILIPFSVLYLLIVSEASLLRRSTVTFICILVVCSSPRGPRKCAMKNGVNAQYANVTGSLRVNGHFRELENATVLGE